MEISYNNRCPDCFRPGYVNGTCSGCGYQEAASSTPSRALAPGTMLDNRYLTGRVLGEGGFGITYKVLDTRTNRIRAMKEYAPVKLCGRSTDLVSLVPLPGEQEHFDISLGRFREEAQTLSKFQNLTAVVDITDQFEGNGTAYFIMEFLSGNDLRQVIKAAPNGIPVGYATRVVAHIADIMAVIHEKTKIIHRDITPENIYVTTDGQVKLLDFGSSKEYAGKMAQNGMIELKPKFAPLEQFSDRVPQGPYTDVYSLAATYYNALTGKKLPSAPDREKGEGYPSLSAVLKQFPQNVSDAVDRALCLDPYKRTQTMREFKTGIMPVINGITSAERPYQGAQQAPHPQPPHSQYQQPPQRQPNQQQSQGQHYQPPQRPPVPQPPHGQYQQPPQSQPNQQQSYGQSYQPPQRPPVPQQARQGQPGYPPYQPPQGQPVPQPQPQQNRPVNQPPQKPPASPVRQPQPPVRPPQKPPAPPVRQPQRPAPQQKQKPPVKQPQVRSHTSTKQIAYLKQLNGPSAGKWWALQPNQTLTVGRSDSMANIRIDAPLDVSRVHIKVCYVPGQQIFKVTDLSENGVFQGAHGLKKNVCYELKAPAVLALASQHCLIEMGVTYESN